MKIAAAIAAVLIATTAVAAQPPANITWLEPDPENTLIIETNKGRIVAVLYPQVAPKHVEQIKALTRQKYYDGNEFFRVIDGFMNQTGDRTNTGMGNSNLPNLQPEFNFRRGPELRVTPVVTSTPNTGFIGVLPVNGQGNAMMAMSADGKAMTQGLHCPGVVSMARTDELDGANNQFFLMRDTTPALDGNYSIFGRVVQGLDVVRAIKVGGERPVAPPRDVMVTVRVLADIPAAERPRVRVMDTSTPAFAAYANRVRTTKGPSFSICDIDITSPAQ